MDKKLLARAGEVVALLFSFGGGVLTNIAPPEQTGIHFALGFGAMITLLLLLFAWTLTERYTDKKLWFRLAVVGLLITLVLGGWYVKVVNDYVYEGVGTEGPVRLIAGTELLPAAQRWWDDQVNPSNENLAKFLVYREHIWVDSSVTQAGSILLVSYLVLIFAFCFTVFALSEGALRER